MLRADVSRKRIFFWNAAGSGVYALSSFVMLLIVVRFCGEEEAGVFSMGFAIAGLMLTIGVFESTIYFATDAANRFSHEQYLAFKIVTCALMVVVSIVYIIPFGFDGHKASVAFALCAFRLLEALTQFWYGAFQKHERLDLGGFSSVWRMIVAMGLFTGVIIVCSDVVLASIVATIGEAVWLVCYDIPRLRKIVRVGRPDFSLRPLGRLFWACLPLFLASFMAAYLSNVAKYAIDAVGNDQMQAVFNALFMPASVINLFLIFFMRPSQTTLADHWFKREWTPFLRILVRLLAIAAGITAAVLAVCAVIGIPVLEWFYGMDLAGLMPALLVVMVGGGFLSASTVFYNALVVIRTQHTVLIGYAVSIVVASIIAEPLVASLGVMGACISFCIASIVLFASFAVVFLVCYRIKTK